MRRLVLIAIAFGVIAQACTRSSGKAAPSATPSPLLPTYYGDVQPILANNCVVCHSTGNIAPFVLSNYATAAINAFAVKGDVGGIHFMPPFIPDNGGACNTWSNARFLDSAQIATLTAWYQDSHLEGNPSTTPAPTPTPPVLAHVDATLDMGSNYTPNFTGRAPGDWHCFVISGVVPAGFLTGTRVNPGQPGEVQGMFLFQTTDSAGDAQASADAAASAGPGYPCLGGPGVADSQLVGTWAAGEHVTLYPSGTGLALLPGRKFILQMHYGSQNEDVADRTTVDLEVDANVSIPATFVFYTDTAIHLSPGLVDTSVTQVFPISAAQTVYGVMGEQLLFGATAEFDVIHGGSPSCLQKIPRCDFRWRQMAFLETPLSLGAGDSVQATCHFSTQAANTVTVFGEGTANEMCRVGLYTALP